MPGERNESAADRNVVPHWTHRGPTDRHDRNDLAFKTPGQTRCAARDLNPEPAD
jgi:hypothetical protein